LPSITISGYVSDENTTKLTNRSGADVKSTDVKPSQESILIEQKLFQGLGGMANLEKNTIGLELSKLKLKKVEQEILLEAIEAYTNLVVSKKKVEINISNVNLLERQVENDKNRLERSEINLTDLAQSEASLAGANARLIEARNHLITGKLNYEKTIGVINNYENLNETYVFNYELPRSLASANKIAKKHLTESKLSKSITISFNNPLPVPLILRTIRSSYLPTKFSNGSKYFLKSGGSESKSNCPLLRERGFAMEPIKFSSKSSNSSSETGYVDSCLYGISKISMSTFLLLINGFFSIAAFCRAKILSTFIR